MQVYGVVGYGANCSTQKDAMQIELSPAARVKLGNRQMGQAKGLDWTMQPLCSGQLQGQ